jgi:hypothetical protein
MNCGIMGWWSRCTHFEVTLAILDFFGEKALDMGVELNIEGLGIDQFVMSSQLKIKIQS